MPINIGNDAVKCVHELRGNPDFVKLLEALTIIARDRIYAAVKAPPELRLHQTSHAEGINELVDGLIMVFEGKTAGQLTKAEPPASPKFRTRENANV